ncbi:hypothetical protein Aduo_011687 [Ancylostoma duodenale]
MTTFDPLLDTEELHTELLKIINSKLDVLNLKVEELTSSTTARMSHLDSRLKATINALPNFRQLDEILFQLLERTAPKSACVFSTIAENADSHPSGRCPRFSGTYARTLQASKLGLCGKCLKWRNVRLLPPESQLLVVSFQRYPASHGQKTQGLAAIATADAAIATADAAIIAATDVLHHIHSSTAFTVPTNSFFSLVLAIFFHFFVSLLLLFASNSICLMSTSQVHSFFILLNQLM